MRGEGGDRQEEAEMGLRGGDRVPEKGGPGSPGGVSGVALGAGDL